MNKYPVYASPAERPVCAALVSAILASNCTISVHDGEEWCLKRSNNKMTILQAMASTGQDTLKARDSEGNVKGVFVLIYNNGNDGEPVGVIADHSDNTFCSVIMVVLSDKFG